MSGKDGLNLPFSAIFGQDDAKLALMVAAVSPHIRSVMLKGASGTAKTVLARSVAGIDPGKSLINVPQNVTDEQLFGSIDLDKAMAGESVELGDSILQRAHGNYLYLDDCDLLDIHTLTTLMNDVLEGSVRVERDGISTSYPLKTTVIASMNIGKKNFDSHVNDCFDLCAVMRRDMNDVEGGMEILRRNLGLTDEEEEAYRREDCKVAMRIRKAGSILRDVKVPRVQVRLISRLCQKYGVAGCRGAIAAAQCARAIAALDGRLEVNDDDVSKAAVLCIFHRRTVDPDEEERKKKERWAREFEAKKQDVTVHDGSRMSAEELEARVKALEEKEPAPEEVDAEEGREIIAESVYRSADPSSDLARSGITVGVSEEDDAPVADGKDIMEIIGEAFETVDILLAADSRGIRSGDEVAKRMFAESGDRKGKYIRSRIPSGQCTDIAFDATIRAAAPYQNSRREGGEKRLIIHKSDVREKVREKEITSTFMFVIDNSGSIVVENALGKIKKAVNSMLMTHYVKRDRVGLMTFNERTIEVKLHPSRAIDQLGSALNRLDADTGTPLSEMLVEVQNYFVPYMLKHPDERVHVVVITDGRATVAMERGRDPVDEALEIASEIDIPNLDWIIIDSGISYTKNDVPEKLAALLHGKYFLLDDLQVKDDEAYGKWKGWNKDKYADRPLAKH